MPPAAERSLVGHRRFVELRKQEAVGTWRRADQFAQAGQLVSEAADIFTEPMVAYFLYCHAIELGLKSFLIGQGYTDCQLRDLGHDLEAALAAAEAHAEFEPVTLTEEDRETISMLSSYYKSKEFEYLFTGSARFPVLGQVQMTCAQLLQQIKPLAWRAASGAA